MKNKESKQYQAERDSLSNRKSFRNFLCPKIALKQFSGLQMETNKNHIKLLGIKSIWSNKKGGIIGFAFGIILLLILIIFFYFIYKNYHMTCILGNLKSLTTLGVCKR